MLLCRRFAHRLGVQLCQSFINEVESVEPEERITRLHEVILNGPIEDKCNTKDRVPEFKIT